MKVAIAGYGQEGEASLKYWQAQGAEITVFDEKQPERSVPDGVETYFGDDAYSQLDGFDLVVRTAGLNPNKIKTDGKVWSATNEFFAKCTVPIIGVTGTKGKGTTSTLISKILENAGFKVWLVGNIGVPALDTLAEIQQYEIRNMENGESQSDSDSALSSQLSALVVFELSSFQLWDLEKSPQTAVVLMIEPDHMDIHASMEEYVNAKSNITTHQVESDVVVYHPTNEFSAQIAAKSSGKKIRYMTDEGAHLQAPTGVILSDLSSEALAKEEADLSTIALATEEGPDKNATGDIVIEGNEICQTDQVALLGAHNLENITAAITAAWKYTQDIQAIKEAVTTFSGLPHRLEFAGEVDGVKFYDDSQATGVGSCLAAIRSFSAPTVLILGGSDKGVDISPVVNELDPERHQVILIGQAGDAIEELLKARSFSSYANLGVNTTMPEIVAKAKKLSDPGSVVLLSPAHASFGMFKNYQDRGDQFKSTVKVLGQG